MRRAQSTTAVRRAGCSGSPWGKWWAGVISAAEVSRFSRSLTTAPSPSNPIGVLEPPVASMQSRKMKRPYASTAIGRARPYIRVSISTA
ncbi:Uncharacterised protein [Mycobacteroides abscessus subsp. abscessus]|nr:Uncharacterised protein [Mycobacteroides abscessus subsp. abscessus]SHV69435.1 Uncharacterised protein [Mycobacteroides abscessus subsp. abscessus]SHX65272.1 Uncharacterised protein [Mycobacteroides abscessus subsp. abscessus]SLI43449.1 Uncharacterised protein [Mycobacteroides abscessus subsp. abscessus]